MDVSSLVDELLLVVFSYLTTFELLQCRAVCHRWASLARDPTLWRNRQPIADGDDDDLSDGFDYWKLVAAVLNFAPSLGELGLVLPSKDNDAAWGTLISTSCAISKVDFYFTSADAVHAALVISRQASLGRLKAVKLKVVDIANTSKSPGSVRSLSLLLIHISHIQGLEEIDLYHDDYNRMTDAVVELTQGLGRASATGHVPASLKRLRVRDFPSFCEPLLQWHADTLEYVHLGGYAPPSALAAPLLSRMPCLRELVVPPLEGMRALLQCPSLTTLELFLYDGPTFAFADRFPEACALVRGLAGTQLQHLTLIPKGNMVHSAGTLLRSLKGSGPTAAVLRSLRFKLHYEEDPRAPLYQQPLVELLHRLPRLSLLDLDSEPTPALLQALDGRAVPELRQLLVRLLDDYAPGCEHQFIHSESVRTLLRNYPRLHVLMKDISFASGCERECCKKACHAVPDFAWCMLFGHEVGARCDVPHGPDYHDCTMYEEATCVAFHISTSTA